MPTHPQPSIPTPIPKGLSGLFHMWGLYTRLNILPPTEKIPHGWAGGGVAEAVNDPRITGLG